MCFVVVIRRHQTNKQKATFITFEDKKFNTMQLRTITVTVFHNIMSLPVIVLIEILSPFLFHYFSKAKLYYQRYFVKTSL